MKNTISELEVTYSPNIILDRKITSSRNAFELIIDSWDSGKIQMVEAVKVILLNKANNVLGIYSLSTGGITSSVVDIRVILAVALKSLATGIIMVHNHPSGNLNPSKDDKEITTRLKESCRLIGIELLDHLVISKHSYYSFADEGIL